MFSWPDVAATALILAAAIIGGYLKVIPEKVVVALCTAAIAYYGARTALAKREAKKQKQQDAARQPKEDDGAAPHQLADVQESGRIEIRPQKDRIVEVSSDGTVHIGPAPGTDYKRDDADPDPTPPEGVPPVDDDESKAS